MVKRRKGSIIKIIIKAFDMTQNAKIDLKDKLKEEFNQFESRLNGDKDSLIHNTRRTAFDRFLLKGFPTVKNELWKYAHLSFLKQYDFSLVDESEIKELPVGLLDKLDYNHLDADLIVLINGFYSQKYSKIIDKDYIKVKSLKNSFNEDFVKNTFGQIANVENHIFSDINTAFTKDGIFIEVMDNYMSQKPLHIINITDSREQDVMVNTRKLIKIGKSSELNILESNYLLGDNKGFTNSVNEIKIDKNSFIDYYKIQDSDENSYSINLTKALQDKDSVFNKTTISIDGKFIRNDIHSEHLDSNCETNYYGFFYSHKQNYIDNHTLVDHAKPDCNSNESYKGILDDRGIGVFNGKIHVRPDAQRTNAYQSNMNILLSDYSTINTKPELEIYADDVKCSHGATSGDLNEEQLFYLISRGISPDKAKSMLLKAFAGDIISHIKIEKVREIVEEKVYNKLDRNN